MKKILLLLCLFLGMQTYAQDEVRELTTVIKVTPSSSERFDVAQLQLELNGQGMPENGFVWDATSSSFKGKLSYNPYEDNFIRLYMPDQSISYEGPIVFDFGNPEITTVEVNADFSPYHYVSFTSGSPEDYTVTLDYLGLSDGSASGQSMPGVVTQRMDDGEFLRAEEYSYELSAFTPEGISVAVKNGKVTVEDEDVAVVTPEKLDDMTLVTFQVKDAEGKPAEAEVILLQANLDLSTDEQGSVQGYLQPGTYYYYPEMEGNYLASPATDFATFTASGNTTTVDYSFQDKGYKPVTFRMEGDVQSGSLTISPVGMEYDEFYVNNIDFPYTVYMVDGLYKYGVQPAYNPPMYFEAEHGLVNTAESRDVVCSFHSSDYGTMRFKLKGAEEGHYYGIHVRRGKDGWSTGFNQIDGEDGFSGMWVAELGLKTGSYTYALERQDYATQQVDFLTLGSFDMEEQQEVEIDLSKVESVSVEVSVANLPDFMEGRSFTCEVTTPRGERLWSYRIERGETKFRTRLPEGEYVFNWTSYSTYSGEDGIEFDYVVHETVEGVSDKVVLDFSRLAYARVNTVVPDGLEADYGNVLSKGDFITDMDFEGSGTTYVILAPGQYEMQAVGSNYEGFDMHISDLKPVTLEAGHLTDVVLNIDRKQEGILVELDVEDVKGRGLAGATVTLNGKVYRTNASGYLTLADVRGDEIRMKVEAEGYLPFEKVYAVNDVYRYIGGTYMTVVLEPKGGSSVSAVETDGLLTVERTVVDGRIVISNATDKVWNVRLVSLSGAVVAQDEAPTGTTELQAGHLRKGMYLLNLYRDGIQKTIKVIKK
ncbi:T9SS type A sorting domain-containing protein [Paraprevotella xylaniphila]|uniref:T9SS type A sorting domain-containing protein n=1 Tax=Paraprevotella xylaniphila TaxID=454155 RepID=UPI0023F291DD|nr:T9SS type A sorting domain-containing protein [Paraprevotella xylaniphila]